MKTSNHKTLKTWQILTISLIPLLGIIIIPLAAVLMPMTVPDGTERFAGDKNIAARMAIEDMQGIYRGQDGIDRVTDVAPPLKFKILRVEKRPTPSTGMWKNCKELYDVTMANISWFGHSTGVYDRPQCLERLRR